MESRLWSRIVQKSRRDSIERTFGLSRTRPHKPGPLDDIAKTAVMRVMQMVASEASVALMLASAGLGCTRRARWRCSIIRDLGAEYNPHELNRPTSATIASTAGTGVL